MKEFIAFCGLDCEKCEALIATVNNDDELRKKVAAEWTELNHVEITPEMINCSGCRVDGVKMPFCDSLCHIRQCGLTKLPLFSGWNNIKITCCIRADKYEMMEKLPIF